MWASQAWLGDSAVEQIKIGMRAEFCSVLRFLTFWFLGDYNNDLDLRIINHQGLTIIIELFD